MLAPTIFPPAPSSFPAVTPINHNSDQHGKISMKVHKWHSHVGSQQLSKSALKFIQQNGNHPRWQPHSQAPKNNEVIPP